MAGLGVRKGGIGMLWGRDRVLREGVDGVGVGVGGSGGFFISILSK